jgi:hypothetical protein
MAGCGGGAQSPTPLLVIARVLVLHWVIVRRSGMASMARRRGDLAPKTKHSDEEESNPAWAFAQLRCLGLSLVSVSYSNLVSLIRISRPPAHYASGLILLAPYKILLRCRRSVHVRNPIVNTLRNAVQPRRWYPGPITARQNPKQATAPQNTATGRYQGTASSILRTVSQSSLAMGLPLKKAILTCRRWRISVQLAMPNIVPPITRNAVRGWGGAATFCETALPDSRMTSPL